MTLRYCDCDIETPDGLDWPPCECGHDIIAHALTEGTCDDCAGCTGYRCSVCKLAALRDECDREEGAHAMLGAEGAR
jgi:hypothetical protein